MESIPVLLDTLPEEIYGGSDALPGESRAGIARCMYFHIEAEENPDPWFLTARGSSFPFLMIGLEGVLISPGGASSRFGDPRQIHELFTSIENAGMHVETGDIWLPAELVFSLEGLRRWDVLRIHPKLFLAAWQLRNGKQTVDEFNRDHSFPGNLEVSRDETEVFAAWAEWWNNRFREWTNSERPE